MEVRISANNQGDFSAVPSKWCMIKIRKHLGKKEEKIALFYTQFDIFPFPCFRVMGGIYFAFSLFKNESLRLFWKFPPEGRRNFETTRPLRELLGQIYLTYKLYTPWPQYSHKTVFSVIFLLSIPKCIFGQVFQSTVHYHPSKKVDVWHCPRTYFG